MDAKTRARNASKRFVAVAVRRGQIPSNFRGPVFIYKVTHWNQAAFCHSRHAKRPSLVTSRFCLKSLRIDPQVPIGAMILPICALKPDITSRVVQRFGHATNWEPFRVMGAAILDATMTPWSYDQAYPNRPDGGIYKLRPSVNLRDGEEPRPSQVARACDKSHFARGSRWCARVAEIKHTTAEAIEKQHRITDFQGKVFLYRHFSLPGLQSSTFAVGERSATSADFQEKIRAVTGVSPLRLDSGPLRSEAIALARSVWG